MLIVGKFAADRLGDSAKLATIEIFTRDLEDFTKYPLKQDEEFKKNFFAFKGLLPPPPHNKRIRTF
ncbi:hypothetical protein CCY98_07490 [Helicobacter sp. 11-8110]|nr:hypothetical protein CCY98_07490 [Helicobacter sp. 11-8110]